MYVYVCVCVCVSEGDEHAYTNICRQKCVLTWVSVPFLFSGEVDEDLSSTLALESATLIKIHSKFIFNQTN